MNGIVDRVTRAIISNPNNYEAAARAAIAAMREPTPQMRAAGLAGTKGSYDSFTFGAYELMIDEALKD